MLPVEAFSDVTSFLGYYDLGGLKLANKMLSNIAHRCADVIRILDLSNFIFCIYETFIDVGRLEPNGDDSFVCQLQFFSERHLAAFIPEAFRNCTVGCFAMMYLRHHTPRLHNAISAVASTVVVAETLCVAWQEAEKMQYVDSFRLVKVRATVKVSMVTPLRSNPEICRANN